MTNFSVFWVLKKCDELKLQLTSCADESLLGRVVICSVKIPRCDKVYKFGLDLHMCESMELKTLEIRARIKWFMADQPSIFSSSPT